MTTRSQRWGKTLSIGLLLCAACYRSHERSELRGALDGGFASSDSGTSSARDASSDDAFRPARSDGGAALPVPGTVVPRARQTPAERGVCGRGGYCVELSNIEAKGVDILFVVDNSGSMQREQETLAAQFPRLLRTLTTGYHGNGMIGPPQRDIHLGVVSTDMGVVGTPNQFPGCGDPGHTLQGGDDGRLLHAGHGDGCESSYPTFLSFYQGKTDPDQFARDFGCIARVGTNGCGFEQPLEAALKALWPEYFIDTYGKVWPPDQNPIRFLATADDSSYGHGDTPPNAGFARNDPHAGLSMLEIVVVTDEEDCSSRITSHLATASGDDDPLSKQGPNLRCFYNRQNLYYVNRYIDGLKRLREGHEDTVVFGAIVGVPPDLVASNTRNVVDFSDGNERDAYYDRILNDPRMQERPVHEDTLALANLQPSCTHIDSTGREAVAYPPRRIVEVAKGFGNSFITSICQDDFGDAFDQLTAGTWGGWIGSQCLPTSLARRDDGKVSCDLIVELPPKGELAQTTPTDCAGPLRAPVKAPRKTLNPDGGVNCKLRQVAVIDGVRESGEGFYYDDGVGEDNKEECGKRSATTIRFTDLGSPGFGLRTYLDCDPDAFK